ncbi:MAG: DNA mismatch repair protein MutS [Chloroflexi bacterium]|nr:DNA mismatch repair protein MutS [Ardenticatenaceae bacterium]MBL1127435.1 DNA mismatch repair protein MutS [Chloroflexota bacterium]NOG33498.1 DNA mismatch repair protein MutS [Chloroflexota bacterium]GIK55809.1 MAG: DNA mismatch repair protein MutS [Chloroflexota bacterium]
MSHITPSRQQYLDIKAQYPDAIVLFRLGDFYETFDDDAQTAARELDLVLTSRPQGKNQRTPMAGVPYHAAEGYIARLIAKGYKVALCEQMSETPINGLMPREVVRVFTAGTVIEPGMLDAGRHNYLAAAIVDGDRVGLAYADITTGTFATTQFHGRRTLTEELARLNPAELLVSDSEHTLQDQARTVSHLPDWRFEEGNARQILLRHFGVASLDAFGCEQKSLATRAAGAVLYYLQETQMGRVGQMQRLATYSVEGYMALDVATRANLELTESLGGERKGSLLSVLDKTVTAMGSRLLREWVSRPLLDITQLNIRLDQVQHFHENALLRADLRATLKGLPDLERLTNRILSGKANPRDVENVKVALTAVPIISEQLAVSSEQLSSHQLPAPTHQSPISNLQSLISNLDPCTEVTDLINRAIPDDAPTNFNKMGVIRSGFSAELDGVMNSSAHAREWVAGLEPRERQRTGIASLKVGFNKVFGYYIEVTHANTSSVPGDYIRKQTLTNAERYITPELKEYETLILNAEERILEIERRVFTEVCQQVAAYAPRLLQTAQVIAELDVVAGLAEAAANQGYVRPSFTNDNTLHIVNGRHPVVEQSLRLERFVPNDVHMTEKERIQIITGPNMSGKSTYLRQTALIVLMAQIGSFVPADEAHIGLADRIFTRIGAHDELHAGRSTFMVEMVETAEILNHASHRSLLILDEIGRGTSTYDGLAIAWAIVEYLHNHPRLKPRTLFATHYHELVGLADLLPLVANYNVAVAEEGDKVLFLHHIVPGGADRSYGIHVAQLAGLPKDVVNRANELLHELEQHAPTTAVTPSRLSAGQQMALFPEASPLLKELAKLDVNSMSPLEAINKLYEWKRRYAET